jgi:hypothetical protein
MRLDRLWVPPIPVVKPKFISGNPILEVYEITRISHNNAIYNPPPKAQPLIPAIIGFLMSSK